MIAWVCSAKRRNFQKNGYHLAIFASIVINIRFLEKTLRTQSDEKLIDSALAGDTGAFNELVVRYYPQVYARLSARSGNHFDRQDIVQEAFLIAWRKLAQLKDKRNFAAWVCRIADNLAKTWHRRQYVQIQFENAFEFADQQKPNGDHREDELNIKAQMRSAYSALSEPHKDVIRHHYFNNRSYEETATLLNIDIDSVRSRLQKARIKLRKEIKHMTTKATKSNIFELNRDDLKALRTAAALCCTDHPNPVLAGVFLEAGGRIVATNGRVLVTRKLNKFADLEENAIIGDCLKMPDVSRATLVLGVDDAVLRFQGKEEVFPVFHGDFPKYGQVFPTNWRNKIRIKSADFGRLVAEISPHLAPCHPDMKGFRYDPVVELCFNPFSLKLSVTTEKNMGYSPLDPKSKAKIDFDQSLDWSHGVAIKFTTMNKKSPMEIPDILFNFGYISNAVTALCLKPDEMVEFRIADNAEEMPLGIFSASDQDQCAMIMPIRR